MSAPAGLVTQLLDAAHAGDLAAHDRLLAVVYDELRRLAAGQLAGDAVRRHHQPTTIVHEAYLRLFGNGHVALANRREFFAAAAEAMRRIRVDDARLRKRHKRGGGRAAHSLDDRAVAVPAGGCPDHGAGDGVDLLDLDDALHKLEQESPRRAKIVKLRFFAGLSLDEIAAVLELSARTIDSEWRFARAWLYRALDGNGYASV